MEKKYPILIGVLGISILSITTAFNLKNGVTIQIEDPRITASCALNQKSSNGSQVAITQSEPDQQPSSPGTCASCHSGGSVTPSVTITASPAFGVDDTYVPGTTYTISYQVTGYSKFGFDLEMNDGNSASSMTAGTLSAVTKTKYTAKPYNQYPANISHSSAISSSSSAVFQWVAPSTPTTVYLFSNGLGVNGTGGTSGDKEVFKNMVLTPENSGTTGLKDVQLTKLNALYPNPARNFVKLEYQIVDEGDFSIEVMDMTGKVILTPFKGKELKGIYSKNMNVSELEKGNYIVRLKLNNSIEVKKLIIE